MNRCEGAISGDFPSSVIPRAMTEYARILPAGFLRERSRPFAMPASRVRVPMPTAITTPDSVPHRQALDDGGLLSARASFTTISGKISNAMCT